MRGLMFDRSFAGTRLFELRSCPVSRVTVRSVLLNYALCIIARDAVFLSKVRHLVGLTR